MDLTLFDDVLVLLEEGNMSRAARRRNITQPAFSRRIQSFEAWIGRPIVTRAANRVEIEPALRANAAELQALVAHVQELRLRLARHDPSRSTVGVAAQHSLIVSTFPDFASAALARYPSLAFRLRAANQNDCLSMFLSGEASLLMCYERAGGVEMPFDQSVVRGTWGRDRLIPVVGGALRFRLGADGRPPADAPIILYPPNSFFGELLGRSATSYATHDGQAVAESAFTAGIKAMALAGLGLAWLPISIVHGEIQSGALIACSGEAETLPLTITLYARPSDEAAARLCALR
jgi:DNA-binding transcriptional LysR family regulator